MNAETGSGQTAPNDTDMTERDTRFYLTKIECDKSSPHLLPKAMKMLLRFVGQGWLSRTYQISRDGTEKILLLFWFEYEQNAEEAHLMISGLNQYVANSAPAKQSNATLVTLLCSNDKSPIPLHDASPETEQLIQSARLSMPLTIVMDGVLIGDKPCRITSMYRGFQRLPWE